MDGPSRIRARRVTVESVPIEASPGAVLEEVFRLESPAVLESAAVHPQYGRYSLFACQPLKTLALRDGILADGAGQVLARGGAALWAALEEELKPCVCPVPPEAGYAPGWIGYVGYEVGRHVERLPGQAVRDTRLPDLRLSFHDALLVHDALERRWSLVQAELDGGPAGAGEAGEALRAAARAAAGRDEPPASMSQANAAPRPAVEARSNFTPGEYRRAVARCLEYIAAGDIFQVNLSQRLTVPDAPASAHLYRALRRRNPAGYAAYLSFSAAGAPCAVVSSSPELFLRLRGREVLTRPIKGTRARTGDGAADAAAAADLLASPKDNAELAMIIDLLRNDLGRVCRYGTVRVAERRRLETHPTVFHLVGTVAGRLHERVSPVGLLKATFPGGSITGAPKIRAMEIIDELEGVARGVYTGCIGIVGVDGSSEWNIAIRTAVCDGPVAHVQVGGGIVADSTPEGEYRETMDKARAMLEALADSRKPVARSQ